MNPLTHAACLIATAQGPGISPEDSRRGFALIVLITLLGVLLLTLAALLTVLSARRRRLRNARLPVRPPTPDPWTESAKRLQPVLDEEDDDEDDGYRD